MILNAQAQNQPAYKNKATIAGHVVLTIIIMVLAYKFLIGPKYAEYGQKQADLTKLNTILTQIQADQRQIKTLAEKLKTAGPSLTALESAVPADQQLSRIHVLVDSLASNVGLTVNNITIEKNNASASGAASIPKVAGIDEYTVGLDLTGDAASFRSFLVAFETAPRLFDLDSVNIQVADTGSATFRVNLVTYIYKPVK